MFIRFLTGVVLALTFISGGLKAQDFPVSLTVSPLAMLNATGGDASAAPNANTTTDIAGSSPLQDKTIFASGTDFATSGTIFSTFVWSNYDHRISVIIKGKTGNSTFNPNTDRLELSKKDMTSVKIYLTVKATSTTEEENDLWGIGPGAGTGDDVKLDTNAKALSAVTGTKTSEQTANDTVLYLSDYSEVANNDRTSVTKPTHGENLTLTYDSVLLGDGNATTSGFNILEGEYEGGIAIELDVGT